MAVSKLSQIADSGSNLVAADKLVGVHGGNTDLQFTGTQVLGLTTSTANTFTQVQTIQESTSTSGSLVISGNTSPPPGGLHKTSVHIVGKDNEHTGYIVDTFGSVGGALTRGIMLFRAANGTNAAPTAVVSGDEIGRLSCRGYGATAYSISTASVSFIAAQTYTDTNQGTAVAIRTTALNTAGGGSTTTPPIIAQFQPSGALSVGDATFVASDPGSGVIAAKTGVLLSGQAAGGSGITLKSPSTASSFTLTLPAGTTDFSATGGTGQVVKQSSAGAALTVGLPQLYIFASVNTESTVHTGDTNPATFYTIAIPGGTIGANGSLRITVSFGYTGTAGAKTPTIAFGGTTFYSTASPSGSTLSAHIITTISNRNNTSIQIGGSTNQAGYTSTNNAFVPGAIDTTISQNLVISGQLANAGDSIAVERYLIEVINP